MAHARDHTEMYQICKINKREVMNVIAGCKKANKERKTSQMTILKSK